MFITSRARSRSRLWRLITAGGGVLATALAVAAGPQAAVIAAQASGVGPPSDQSGNISASFHPTGTKEDVFYVGPHRQIYRWQHHNGHWSNGPIAPFSGAPAEPGTGVAAVWSPGGTSLHVFYTGANGQIDEWLYQNNTWTNGPLGAGEAAEPGTGLSATWSQNQVFLDVFYVGANGQLYSWSQISGRPWGNGPFPGSSVEPGTGVAAFWSPDGTALHLYYVSTNGQIDTFVYQNGHWSANAQLGNGAAAEPGTALTAAESPNQVFLDVYYVGTDGQIYAWSQISGGNWGNAPLETGKNGEPAQPGTGLSTAWQPDGAHANVYYVGANGQLYTWLYHAGGWANSQLGTGEPAHQGTGVPIVWNPSGTQGNLFYKGANGNMYNWYGNATSPWHNGKL